MTSLNRILGLVLVAPILAACSVVPSGTAPVAPVAVHTAVVTTADVRGSVVYSGDAASRAKVSVIPRIPGQITRLNVDVGSKVNAGDVIAELDHASLDAQVAQAAAGLSAAKARLATIQSGPRPETIAEAKANLASAQAALDFLQGGGRSENVRAAQGNLDAAVARLNALRSGRPETVAQAQANLAAATAKFQTLQNGARPETVAQAKANLDAAAAKLQQLKDGPTPQQVAVARQAVEQAKDAAYAADVNKDGACNPRNPQYLCDAAKAAAAAAETGVNTAQAQLDVLTSKPTTDLLNQAQAGVDAARQQYALAQHPYTAQDVAQAQAAVHAASAELRLAEHPGSSADLAAAQGAVESAQAAVDLARQPSSSADLARAASAVDIATQQLRLAEQPFTASDEDAAKAAVQQAQAALEAARVARDQAILTAPISGVVSQKLLSVGALAGPTSPIAVLIDPRVEVVLAVDPAQANALHLGDPATITSDAFPGKTVPGKIETIAPSADPRTHTVEVKVAPNDSSVGLADGTIAQVRLVTATHRGAIVVPSIAIVQRDGNPVVYVVTNGIAAPRTVQNGLSDGTNTEVTSGLKVGETIVVSGQDQLKGTEPVGFKK